VTPSQRRKRRSRCSGLSPDRGRASHGPCRSTRSATARFTFNTVSKTTTSTTPIRPWHRQHGEQLKGTRSLRKGRPSNWPTLHFVTVKTTCSVPTAHGPLGGIKALEAKTKNAAAGLSQEFRISNRCSKMSASAETTSSRKKKMRWVTAANHHSGEEEQTAFWRNAPETRANLKRIHKSAMRWPPRLPPEPRRLCSYFEGEKRLALELTFSRALLAVWPERRDAPMVAHGLRVRLMPKARRLETAARNQ